MFGMRIEIVAVIVTMIMGLAMMMIYIQTTGSRAETNRGLAILDIASRL